MAAQNIGKITQVISAVLDIKFGEGVLPEINDAVEITRQDGTRLVVSLVRRNRIQRVMILMPEKDEADSEADRR